MKGSDMNFHRWADSASDRALNIGNVQNFFHMLPATELITLSVLPQRKSCSVKMMMAHRFRIILHLYE